MFCVPCSDVRPLSLRDRLQGVHENIPAPVETLPDDWIIAACPLCGQKRRYLPAEIFQGRLLGNVNYGKALILINRSDYFQAGLIIRKGSYDEIQARGLDQFRTDIRKIAPYLGDRVDELRDWDQIKILTVQINRLRRWHRPGLLCIGDAAHAMSPAGGVGINLAIQDAVAAANLLTRPLLERWVPDAALAAVERRRILPTRVTQGIQLAAHRGFERVFDNPGPIRAPW